MLALPEDGELSGLDVSFGGIFEFDNFDGHYPLGGIADCLVYFAV